LEVHDQLSPVQDGRTIGRIAAPTAMSIDVEDWFHVENLRGVVSRESWNRRELRVERMMDRMLELMDEHDAKATCFVLGWVAERAPSLVRRLAAAGHEVASHGYHHELVHELTERDFAADVRRSKDVLEGITGERVRGYRAPSFSLTDWAIPLLEEAGFEYDSSFFPTTVTGNRYGKPTVGGTDRLRLGDGGLAEVPLSCLRIGGQGLPWAGGGYFRLLPYPLFKLGVEKVLGSGSPYVFYIHPWELDPGQPRVAGLRRSQRVRHYLNLDRTESRWTALLTDFRWMTIADLLRTEGAKQTYRGYLSES